MAVSHSPAGFTGTVDQVDEARRLAIAGGGRFRVNGSTDWAVTASSSVNRTVDIAAGSAAACGVLDATTAADSVTFAANGGSSDRFDVVVASFDWATMTITFRVVQGTTVPPVIVRTGTIVDVNKINWLPGTRYDAVLAVIRVRPGVAMLAPADLYDSRPWGSWSRLSVVSAAYRDKIDVDPDVRIRETSGARIEYVKQLDGTWAKTAPGLLVSFISTANSGYTGSGMALQRIVGIINVPAHVPGVLRVRVSGAWLASGQAAGFLYIGWSNSADGAGMTTAPGSKVRIHNYANAEPMWYGTDGYIETDGAPKYLWVLGDTDSLGIGYQLLDHSWSVWQI